MKRLFFLAFALYCLTLACKEGDTVAPELWPRSVEPRLSDEQWGTAPEPRRDIHHPSCNVRIETRAQALRALGNERCLDEIIRRLDGLAQNNIEILSDLAAAYFVRAASRGNAKDLFAALDVAERAVATRPHDAKGRFNHALILERIGLMEQALEAWNAVPADGSGWGAEARKRAAALTPRASRDANADWEGAKAKIRTALAAGDAAAIAKWIEPSPRSAVDLLREVIVPEHLDPHGIYAQALSRRLGNDPWILALGAGDDEATRMSTEIARARERALGDNIGALDLLSRIGPSVQAQHSRYLLAQWHMTRGYVLFQGGRFLESNAAYATARPLLETLNDLTNLASAYRSTGGNFREIGEHELSARDLLLAVRFLPAVTVPRIRHMTLGETASTALRLGHERAALTLQNAAIRSIQKAILANPPEATERIQESLKLNMSVALRERARIHYAKGSFEKAIDDLQEAIGFSNQESDAHVLRMLRAHMIEVEGLTLLPLHPILAAGKFREALTLVQRDDMTTFRVTLLTHQAMALRHGDQAADAARVLEVALRELAAEEATMLAGKDIERKGIDDDDEIWRAYFSRFNEAYEQLIRHLLDTGRDEEALDWSERQRAVEPLYLARSKPLPIAEVRQRLPEGTVLLHYRVMADRSYVWIVSRDRQEVVSLDAGREAIERWTNTLLEAARNDAEQEFARGLATPYQELIAEPLRRVARNGRPARLVIVPDGPMHGLPFPALHDPEHDTHLVELAPIEIAGSASLYVLSLIRDAEQQTSDPTVLLVGDPAFDPKASIAVGMRRLPASLREVDDIARNYGLGVTTLTDEAATPQAFLAAARDSTIVHIAAHARVNAQQPSRSVILFAQTPTSSGAIEARELVDTLKLDRPRLVVLAACSSAGGSSVGPEGVAPLVRPLIAAGVPGVVGALWDVNDIPSRELFVAFHRHYQSGKDAAEALRTAQIDILERNKKAGLGSSLLAWAPFQVIGHATSPFGAAHNRMEDVHGGFHRKDSLQRNAGLHPQ